MMISVNIQVYGPVQDDILCLSVSMTDSLVRSIKLSLDIALVQYPGMYTSQSDAVILNLVQKVTWSRFRTNISLRISRSKTTIAASLPFHFIELNENEVPGAKFVYERIDKHSNTQLTRWLECRGLRKTGNRSEILKRVHSCISAGKDKDIDVGVDCGKWYTLKKERKLQHAPATTRVPLLPYSGWGKFPSCQDKMPKLFNKGHIHHHIVESVQFVNANEVDDESDDDIEDLHTAKPMQKGLKFFESGHVRKMQDCLKSDHYFLKCKVMASMRTNVEYDVTATLSVHSGFVKDASCTCVASAMGRCSHVTGLLYALENFLELSGKDPASCTSLPCTWNRGRQTQKNPKRVQELSYSSKKRKIHSVIDFDPRGPSTVNKDENKVKDNFLWNLQNNRICGSMWNTLLEFDYEDYEITNVRMDAFKEWRGAFLENLKVSEGTRFPSLLVDDQRSDRWFTERRVRLTASDCHTVAHLQSGVAIGNFLYRKLWSTEKITSAALSYGVQNEAKALSCYRDLHNSERMQTIETGLWVNGTNPELACSPDGLILDLDEANGKYGLLEIKCPKVLESQKISDFESLLSKSQLKTFCLEVCNGEKILKRKHPYFYQVQMQMGVTGLKFCDFVVWSNKETFVQRIRFDETFWVDLRDKLIRFHHSYICPELFEIRTPRELSCLKII